MIQNDCLTLPLSFVFPALPLFDINIADDDMMEDANQQATPPSSPFTKKTCFAMLDQTSYDSPLPAECQQIAEVKSELRRRNSDRATQAIAFQGMHAGEAAAAMASREHGSLSHAQIQRRMTNNSKPRLW